MIHATQAHALLDGKAKEYLEGWQRARAELDNFRKSLDRQQEASRQQSLLSLVEPLLGLADNFRAMTAHVPPKLTTDAWVEGVLHIARQLDTILEQYGVVPIDNLGTFDPTVHEAVETVTVKGVPAGEIVATVTPGYKLGDRVIRPAKVKVAQ